MQGYQDLSPAITDTTRLSDMLGSGGDGIRVGTIVINDGTNTLSVDLAGVDRIGEIIDRINAAAAAAGASIAADYGADGQSLSLSSGEAAADLTVTESGTGQTGRDLGIYRSTGQGDAFDGDNIRPLLTPMTRLADLAAGAGIDLDSGLQIVNGGKSGIIKFTGDQTLGDLINRINASGLGVLARVNSVGTGIDIINVLSGSEMRIGENGGTTANDLGVRSMQAETKLSELNDGLGVHNRDGYVDFTITAGNGSSMNINITPGRTVGELISQINTVAMASGVNIHASLNAFGNGIHMVEEPERQRAELAGVVLLRSPARAGVRGAGVAGGVRTALGRKPGHAVTPSLVHHVHVQHPVAVQRPAQRLQGVVGPRLHRARRDAQHRGRLAQAAALEVELVEHAAVVFGQALEGLENGHGGDDAVGVVALDGRCSRRSPRPRWAGPRGPGRGR